MCGIFGIVGRSEPLWADAGAALDAIASRGPDARALVEVGDTLLGHRRLSIIDIEGGSQPMATPDGRYTIVYNGEVYNFRALRTELEAAGHCFRSRSDTEVLLAGHLQWGNVLPERLDGMFAYAIWDAAAQTLIAARDRIGVKPFFYGFADRSFVFASTLAPFLSLRTFRRRLDPLALRDYLAFQTVLAPRTILAGVRQLEPASRLEFRAGTKEARTERYWRIPPPGGAPQDAEDRVRLVDKALTESVARQLVADVPLGAFLSGGIDSGLVVACMAEAGAKPLRSFNVRFRESAFDETEHALAVAQRYGAEHRTVDAPELDGKALLEAIGALDQPLADPAYVVTRELSRLTRTSVTVAMSGDGADELFGGYPRFLDTEARFPDSAFRRALRHGISLGLLPTALTRRGLAGRARMLYGRVELGPFGHSRKGFANFLQPEMIAACEPEDTLAQWLSLAASFSPSSDAPIGTDSLMRADLWTYLSEDCLVKTDRASMSASLEVRVPFLGNPVLDCVLGWPAATHFDDLGGKAILRRLAEKKLPESAWNRPKHGFSVPLQSLFAGAWRDPGEAVIGKISSLAPWLQADAVSRLWHDAQAGRASRRLAYSFLVLLLWLDRHRIAP